MTAWLIRAGKNGEDENKALEKGLAIVGWRELPNASKISSYDEMKIVHRNHYPEMKVKAIMNHLAQFWSFSRGIKKGDIAVLPMKTQSTVALGKILSNYTYKGGRHVRKVDWIREDIPRKDFSRDLLFCFGSLLSICRITRNNAEDRLKVMLTGKPDPNLKRGLGEVESQPGEVDEDSPLVDLEEQTFDQIRGLIESKFKGHNLARLVEAILNQTTFH